LVETAHHAGAYYNKKDIELNDDPSVRWDDYYKKAIDVKEMAQFDLNDESTNTIVQALVLHMYVEQYKGQVSFGGDMSYGRDHPMAYIAELKTYAPNLTNFDFPSVVKDMEANGDELFLNITEEVNFGTFMKFTYGENRLVDRSNKNGSSIVISTIQLTSTTVDFLGNTEESTDLLYSRVQTYQGSSAQSGKDLKTKLK
jgi:hypothetical protein